MALESIVNVETAATKPALKQAFHSGDLEQVAEYRTMSSLAIVSLIFGLLSPLCFVMPLLLAIPLFGAAVSIVALRQIAASEGALAGRWAAATGLALCVASAAAAVTDSQATRYLRSQQAEKFGREWIGLLLTGKTDQAFQLTVAGAQPAFSEPGEPTATQSPRERFGQDRLVEALVAAGPQSTVRYDGTLTYQAERSGQLTVEQKFTITPPKASGANDESEGRTIEAVLTLQRSRMPGRREVRWLVLGQNAPRLTADDHAR